MSSTRYVDYSLRRNKAIERKIVFEGLSALRSNRLLDTAVTYVGLGSVWFVDFDLAHRNLDIQDMISIEADPVVAARARYNVPFRCVEVREGFSRDILPLLLAERAADGDTRALVIWLDYDGNFDEDCRAELLYLVERCPIGTVLLTTVRTSIGDFGGSKEAVSRASVLLGDAFPIEHWPTPHAVPRSKEQAFCVDIGIGLSTLLHSYVSENRRDVDPVELFAIPYQDGTPMHTVGIGLFAPSDAEAARTLVTETGWRGKTEEAIITPPLTAREAGALRSILPSPTPLSRTDVKTLGFDLEDTQLESFCKYYLDTPTFIEAAR